jgi:hypothetical protein
LFTDCYIIPFNSSTELLKVEKLLLRNKYEVRIIPTPRKFGDPCGMSIKINESDLNYCLSLLNKENMTISKDRIHYVN